VSDPASVRRGGNLPVPPYPLHRSAFADERLHRWLSSLLATPGLTSVRDPVEARRLHLEGSLAGAALVADFPGSIVDVGSGGGAPGIPLAAVFPEREVTLLEARDRKCDFLREAAREFPNVRVVHGRAEEQETDRYDVAVAKALAAPPVAAELCLPLVEPGGAVVLWVGPSAEPEPVGIVSSRLGGSEPELHPGFLVLRKVESTPAGFPRRSGMAKKRPLA
jgi:16S rRNA (guanine527-N7)-methyltransferase